MEKFEQLRGDILEYLRWACDFWENKKKLDFCLRFVEKNRHFRPINKSYKIARKNNRFFFLIKKRNDDI